MDKDAISPSENNYSQFHQGNVAGNSQTCEPSNSTSSPVTTGYLTACLSKVNEYHPVVDQQREPCLFYYQYTNGEQANIVSPNEKNSKKRHANVTLQTASGKRALKAHPQGTSISCSPSENSKTSGIATKGLFESCGIRSNSQLCYTNNVSQPYYGFKTIGQNEECHTTYDREVTAENLIVNIEGDLKKTKNKRQFEDTHANNTKGTFNSNIIRVKKKVNENAQVQTFSANPREYQDDGQPSYGTTTSDNNIKATGSYYSHPHERISDFVIQGPLGQNNINKRQFSDIDKNNESQTGQSTLSHTKRKKSKVTKRQRQTQFNNNYMYSDRSPASAIDTSPSYIDLGDSDWRCEYCGASFWYGERLKGGSTQERPRYNRCCAGGKLHLQEDLDPPQILYTIEFQKRGLPHCHTLLWLHSDNKIQSAEDVDKFIFAELPDKSTDPEGYKVVADMMVHGPCGAANTKAPCMQEGNCSKNFPKKYNDKTFFDENGHVHYRRRKTHGYATRGSIRLDNSYIVPYNRLLCLTLNAHINVEYCGWSMLIKYLFKYISKGTDRIAARIIKPLGEATTSANTPKIHIDEIKNFIDGRFICPYEACWRILNFPIHHREPAVQILAVHLKDMQQIKFRDKEPLPNVISDDGRKLTTLTEWFTFNTLYEEGRHLTYLDFPSEFVWYENSKTWRRRRYKSKSSVGRLAYVHPSAGELFYFRMLLCHQKGCQSFIDVRKVNNRILPTYRATCQALGLLEDDKEWDTALQEAELSVICVLTHIYLPCLNPQKQPKTL